jgi:site-specific DNA recombinase
MFEGLKFCRYLRKSNEAKDKQAESIESQREALKPIEKQLEIHILREFRDEKTGHKPGCREDFTAMVKAIEAGEINAISVWKADRLARNPVEGGFLIYLLQNGILQCIKTPYNTYLPTDNTLPLTIEFGMANQYSLDLSRNVKRGNKTKIEKGGHCHMAPQGYLNDKENRVVIKDPTRFDQVRKMWDLLLTNVYSLEDICKVANEKWGFNTVQRKRTGGNELTPSTLHGIFNNRFYYGYLESGENENWGNHEPIINESEFERAQEILRKRCRKTKSNVEFPFTGVIRCNECNCQITAQEKVKYVCPDCGKHQSGKNPKPCLRCKKRISKKVISQGKWYTYYHCTRRKGNCKQPSVRAEALDQQINSILSSIELDADFEEWSIKWFKFLNEEKFGKKKNQNDLFQRNYQQSENKLKRLIEMRAENELTKEQFLDMKKEAQRECNQWKERFKEAETVRDDWVEKVEKEIDFVHGLCKRFAEGTIKEKRYIFEKIGSNFILKDGILALDIGKEYLSFKKLESQADLTLEPSKLSPQQVEEIRSGESYPKWWAILDSNQ